MLSRGLSRMTVLPVTPEKNATHLVAELVGFLSKKANTSGTLEYSITRAWLAGELTHIKLRALYESSYLPSQLNKILLKIVLLPRIVLMSFVDSCLPRAERKECLTVLETNKNDLMLHVLKQQQFTHFIKMSYAKDIYAKQLAKAKHHGLVSAFLNETIESAYESSWIDINHYGDPDYEADMTVTMTSVNRTQFNRVRSPSPLSWVQEWKLFRQGRSISPIPMSNTPDTILSTPSSSPTL